MWFENIEGTERKNRKSEYKWSKLKIRGLEA